MGQIHFRAKDAVASQHPGQSVHAHHSNIIYSLHLYKSLWKKYYCFTLKPLNINACTLLVFFVYYYVSYKLYSYRRHFTLFTTLNRPILFLFISFKLFLSTLNSLTEPLDLNLSLGELPIDLLFLFLLLLLFI